MDNDMPRIAGTYQVIGRIGAGGGGIVYLAEHLRLGKKVVLKADKRTLSAKPEVLRREVDALKNLSHTYIPQVYDFIEEGGIVYTVMDYIDGDSFDKPLKRGERFTQAQVIEWACQLLDALAYLHSRPPHGILHADIKPSNVMRTSQGDIRLIDFNIALALGEEGAVAVGRSFGYASPEHYGTDYSPGIKTREITTDVITVVSSDTVSDVRTVQDVLSSSHDRTSDKKAIMLNVRSDIYSLGATLYHILTGERPAQQATEVKPISSGDYSSAVIKIIAKAMNPDQNMRWQSAEEMLRAFEHLRENDPRTKRHKRRTVVTTAMLIIMLLLGGFITLVGLKQMEQLQNAYVLAEYSENALRGGDVDKAIDYALRALPEKRDIFTPPDTAEAQKALADALDVYDLSDGFKTHKTLELPSAPLCMEISADGKCAVAAYSGTVVVFNTDTAEIMFTLPMETSALAEVKFLDNNTIIYAGENGIAAYDIMAGTELWKGKPATSIRISANKIFLAAVYKDESFAAIYEVSTGKLLQEVRFDGKHQSITVNDSFANPNDNLLALNRDGTMLGVSFSDGSLWVYDLQNRDGSLELFDAASGYTHFEGGFYEDYFAFSASKIGNSVFAVIDTIEAGQTGGFESESYFGVQTDETGIFVKSDNFLVKIHPITGEQQPLVTTAENIIQFSRSSTHTLVTSENELMFFDKNANLTARHEKEYGTDFIQIAEGMALIGSLNTPVIRIMKYESNKETEVFSYDQSFAHDEARISADGKTVMLFSFDRFRLYDVNGNIITETLIPDADRLYDQQYRRDEQGSRLEVIYNDGKTRAYSAVDGTVLYETFGEQPDLTLYEEFFTDTLRITSPLHGTPTAYDRESGKPVRELEKDAYLTYVTQVGEYIVTQYVTANGEYYALLLNSKCETLARLPNLCDIVDDKLIFDYPTGNLRKSHIYNTHELIEIARS